MNIWDEDSPQDDVIVGQICYDELELKPEEDDEPEVVIIDGQINLEEIQSLNNKIIETDNPNVEPGLNGVKNLNIKDDIKVIEVDTKSKDNIVKERKVKEKENAQNLCKSKISSILNGCGGGGN